MRIDSMLTFLACAGVAACGAAQFSGGGGGGGQSSVSAGPVPAGVRKTVEEALGSNARIRSEREAGVIIYEAASQTKVELELSETGALHTTELALPIASLPTAVVAALDGKGKIDGAEVVITATGVAFEIEIGETEYMIDAAGKILEQHADAEHENGEEDDED